MTKYGMEISKKEIVKDNGSIQKDDDRWEQILNQDMKLQGHKTQVE